MTGCVLVVSARASLGPSLTRRATSSPSASDASARVEVTAGWSPQASSMPTACEPCPGKTKADACMVVFSSGGTDAREAGSEIQQHRAPCETAADTFEHQRVTLADLAAADRGIQ